ncbi:hypothetical protein EYZ11_000449 [Aspergillus tanneri]|uniref:Cytochrome P450-dit2 n=1 Tax=Aspergillus tanneri TaxID=1220188 RepID=A0A4S3JXM5_9EURO|nr:hypothetical protein EYZ11_000449 [Aspergillus tanneri]
MIWYTLVLGLMALCAFDYFWRLYKNIRLVRPINLPYVVVPFSSTSIFMIILLGTKWVLHILHRWLPDDVADVLDDTMLRTRWTVKDRVAKRLGGVYMKATSKALICSVSDASVASQIFSNRQKFPKPTQQYEVLELYGPNLVSCEGREWQHHRRHTATIFNEKNSTLVWKEAIQQTQQMIEHWREASPDTAEKGFMVEKLKADGLKLTLTILSNAGFGVPIPFKPVPQGLDKGPEGIFKDATVPPEGFDFTFRAVLAYISAHIATVILAYKVVPKWFPRQLVPVWGKQVAAYRDLDAYLNKLIAAPKAEKDNFESTANLIDGMLLSSRRAIHQGANDGGLSDIEIMGNTFIFTIAGHETTAATFSYALLLLALHQDVQEWLHRGIVEATREEPPEAADWDYTSLFPKLATPLCVMVCGSP